MGFNPATSNLGSINDVALNSLQGYDSLVYDGTIAKWKNAAVSSRTHTPAVGQGELSFNILDYGADGTSANDSKAFQDAINAANQLDTDGNPKAQHIYVPAGNWRPKINIKDQNLILYGPGVLMQETGFSVIRAEASLGTDIQISSIGRVTYTDIDGNGSSYTSFIFTNPSSVPVIKNADIMHLASKDKWAVAYVDGETSPGYKAAIVPVLGIAVDFTYANGGALAAYTTVRNKTNTATGYIQSVLSKNGGANTLIFYTLTGKFLQNDIIISGGSEVATVTAHQYMVSATTLIDTFATDVVLRKMNSSSILDVDVTVSTFGDPYRSMVSKDRKPSIDVYGYCFAKIKVHTKQAYTRSVTLTGAYMVDVDSYMEQGANNTAQIAVGYGPEVAGATTACTIRTRGGGMRHGFTTNTHSGSEGYPSATDPDNVDLNNPNAVYDNGYKTYNSSLLRLGAPNANVVTGVIANSLGAGFDTHHGAYNTIFLNCVSIYNGSGGAVATSSTGFNNRGFGTQFINCISIGANTGFKDSAGVKAAPYDNTITYKNCQALDYREYGFNFGGTSTPTQTSFTTRYQLDDISSAGDGSPKSSTLTQYGLCVGGGRNTTVSGGSHRKFNYAGIFIQGNTLTADIINSPYLDFTECPSTALGLVVDGYPNSGKTIIESLKIKSATVGGVTIPQTLISGNGGNIRVGNIMDINGLVTSLIPSSGFGNVAYMLSTGYAFTAVNTWVPSPDANGNGSVTAGATISKTFTIDENIPTDAFVVGWTNSLPMPIKVTVSVYISAPATLTIKIYNGMDTDWSIPANTKWRSKIML